jgi:hypothetical protein
MGSMMICSSITCQFQRTAISSKQPSSRCQNWKVKFNPKLWNIDFRRTAWLEAGRKLEQFSLSSRHGLLQPYGVVESIVFDTE